MSDVLYESNIEGLPLAFRGKVRDVYDLGDALLIVTSDRLSAFDVVLPTPIPDKGRVLSTLSRFWFERTTHLVKNHLLDRRLEDVVPAAWVERLRGRSQIVRKAQAVAGRGGRARLSRRLRLGGVQAQRLGVRAAAAGRAAPGRSAARGDLHAVDQGARRRARSEHHLRAGRQPAGRRHRHARARPLAGDLPLRRRSGRSSAASSSPTPSSSSASTTARSS